MQEKGQLYADKNRPNVDEIRLFIDKKRLKIRKNQGAGGHGREPQPRPKRPPSPASPTTKPSHQPRTPDNTMKNTSLGVWGAAMSGPKKNVAAVPPPEGVRGAGRSAPRERRRGEAPSTAPAHSAYDHFIGGHLRRGSR